MKKLFLGLTVLALLMMPMAAMADVLVTDPLDLASSRSSSNTNEIFATASWDAGDFTIGWNVTGGLVEILTPIRIP